MKMPKPRKAENRGLPKRWRLAHGAYYYQVPPGSEALWEGKKLFRLGKTLPEAYRVWAEHLESAGEVKTISELLDRYALEILPTKAIGTQDGHARHIKRLRVRFGQMLLPNLQPQHIYQYADKRGKQTSARLEIAVLSHAFTKAVEWGYLNAHPFKGEVRLQGSKPRTRYVSDDEIIECLALNPTRKRGSVTAIQAYIRLKLLTGLRQGDLLRLREEHFKEDGIHVTPRKTQDSTGKQMIYEWSDALRAAVKMAKAARPVDISPFLFCNKLGEGYFDEENGRAYGWASMWQRFMARVLKETAVKERFTEHDLRAKAASDADTVEHARALLAHADSRITQRVYRRKAEVVKPLR